MLFRSCYRNQLTSLEGAPLKVGWNFSCPYNQLTSLKGAPEKVGWNFYCSYNQLTSLEGAPREVKRDFYCMENQLTSLEGAPRDVGGNYYFSENPVSVETLNKIISYIIDNPEMNYGAILASLESKIPQEDWKKLDKSSLDKMNQTRKKVYGMLGGIGGI